MENIEAIKPLLRENLVELISYGFIKSQFSSELMDQLNKDWLDYRSIAYLSSRIKYKLYINNNVLAFQVGDAGTMPFERFAEIGGKVIEETDEEIIVPSIVPYDLKGIDPERIKQWTDTMFHITANRAANRINQRLLVAELFSGSVASDEFISYEFIKRKCSNSPQSAILGPIHRIPILGKINLEKFIEFRSNELPSFISFRREWNEGREAFKEEISSKTWIDNINKNLDKCKAEIDKCKQKIFGNIVEGFAWAGLGIAAGIYSGSPFNPAIITAIPPLARDIIVLNKTFYTNLYYSVVSVKRRTNTYR